MRNSEYRGDDKACEDVPCLVSCDVLDEELDHEGLPAKTARRPRASSRKKARGVGLGCSLE